jgi:hypothetical protein
MSKYVRAVTSDEEKSDTKSRANQLGLTESQIVRAGLKKMGVRIKIEKTVGAPVGNQNKKKNSSTNNKSKE